MRADAPPPPPLQRGTISGVQDDVQTAASAAVSGPQFSIRTEQRRGEDGYLGGIHALPPRRSRRFGYGMEDSTCFRIPLPDRASHTRSVTTRSALSLGWPGSGGTSLQNTVNSAIRAVLGRPVSAADPKSFQSSLNAAFTINQFEGHTVWTYTPRAFAGAAEFGESLTGAQASLAALASNALNQTLPMIDALTTLDPTVETDALEAKRAIVRTEWNEFVLELQTPGGPRAARADMILAALTRPDGYLYEFGRDLGMVDQNNQITRNRVVTLDDEDNLTKYISLRDYISAASNSWLNYRDTLYGSDLGTSLLGLSRALSVVADELTDLTDALDSVYVAEPERLTIKLWITPNPGLDIPPPIPMGGGEPPISLGNPVLPAPICLGRDQSRRARPRRR